METGERGIVKEALAHAMRLRGNMKPIRLAELSGVDKSTISQILSETGRPNTPAWVAVKLARALYVSTDYLMGLSDEPEPRSLQLGELVIELIQVAKKLTARRQRDLLLTARGYVEATEELRQDPDLLMDTVLDLVREARGSISHKQLLDRLDQLVPDKDDEDDGNGDGDADN